MSSNRSLAPVLFGSFVVLVVLILMNIFLAILNDAFAIVSERQRKTQNVTGLLLALFQKRVLRRQMGEMLTEMDSTSALLHDDEALMAKMDLNGDAYLDVGELEALLRQTRLYEHFTVKELIQRFDADGDGKLSGAEVREMNEALLRKRRQVDMQLAAQLSPRKREKVASIFTQHENDDGDMDGPPGSGSLSTSELQHAIEEMGYQITPAQLATLMSEFDADGSKTLDLLEFTALMARMLGYRELPSEQHRLLRKVFEYIDVDDDGLISPDELRVIIERFGIKMPAAQLAMYINEFDADGDGQINVTEFLTLMSKLHGRIGITINPTLIAKDLQLTVRKLEQLVATNAAKQEQAIAALVAEATLDKPTTLSTSLAAKAARRGLDSTVVNPINAVAAAAAAAAAAQVEPMAAALLAPGKAVAGARMAADGTVAAEKGTFKMEAMSGSRSAPRPPVAYPTGDASASGASDTRGMDDGLCSGIDAVNTSSTSGASKPRRNAAGQSTTTGSGPSSSIFDAAKGSDRHGGGGGAGEGGGDPIWSEPDLPAVPRKGRRRGGEDGHSSHSGRRHAKHSPTKSPRQAITAKGSPHSKSKPGRMHRHGAHGGVSGRSARSVPDDDISLDVFSTEVASKVGLEKRLPVAEATKGSSPPLAKGSRGGSGHGNGRGRSRGRSNSPKTPKSHSPQSLVC